MPRPTPGNAAAAPSAAADIKNDRRECVMIESPENFKGPPLQQDAPVEVSPA
jgi:hypothetical protein